MEGRFGIVVLSQEEHAKDSGSNFLHLLENEDPLLLQKSVNSNRVVIELRGLSDSKAYALAILLRRRMQFAGDLRAVGKICPDQLPGMALAGFTSAVLGSEYAVAATLLQLQKLDAIYGADAKNEYASW